MEIDSYVKHFLEKSPFKIDLIVWKSEKEFAYRCKVASLK